MTGEEQPPDERLERLAELGDTGELLACGHVADILERYRPGTERWCLVCGRWEPIQGEG